MEEITYKNVLALQSWVHRQNQYGVGSFLLSILGCLTASPSEFSLFSSIITHIPVQSRAEQSCSAQVVQVPMCTLADKLIWGRASQSFLSVSKPKLCLILPLSAKFNPDIIIRAVSSFFFAKQKADKHLRVGIYMTVTWFLVVNPNSPNHWNLCRCFHSLLTSSTQRTTGFLFWVCLGIVMVVTQNMVLHHENGT